MHCFCFHLKKFPRISIFSILKKKNPRQIPKTTIRFYDWNSLSFVLFFCWLALLLLLLLLTLEFYGWIINDIYFSFCYSFKPEGNLRIFFLVFQKKFSFSKVIVSLIVNKFFPENLMYEKKRVFQKKSNFCKQKFIHFGIIEHLWMKFLFFQIIKSNLTKNSNQILVLNQLFWPIIFSIISIWSHHHHYAIMIA